MSNKCREAFEKSGFSDTGNQWEIWREAYEAAMQERGGAINQESKLQPLKEHLLKMIEYSKDAGALSFPMAYELHQKTLEAVAILIRIEKYVTNQTEPTPPAQAEE